MGVLYSVLDQNGSRVSLSGDTVFGIQYSSIETVYSVDYNIWNGTVVFELYHTYYGERMFQ